MWSFCIYLVFVFVTMRCDLFIIAPLHLVVICVLYSLSDFFDFSFWCMCF